MVNKWYVRAGRNMAPFFAKLIHYLGMTSMMMFIEKYIAFLLGKGSGSGWDTKGEVKSISRFINNNNPVIFDIGANDGRWSLELCRHLDAGAKFYLFECASYCFHGLERRMKDIPNAKIIKHALSDHQGSIDFHVTTVGSGCGSVHERKDAGIIDYDYKKIKVEAVSLDNFCADNQIEHIDFLKMDIEGHEYTALKGALRMLKEHKISALSFEFGSSNVNSRTYFKDFFELLSGNGYNIYRIIPGGLISSRITFYSENLEYFRGATNYIASVNPNN